MDKLREQGLEDNTIIYFSTDQAAHVEEVAQGSKVIISLVSCFDGFDLATSWWS